MINYIKIGFLILIPFIIISFSYYLKSLEKQPWMIRKYLHTVGLSTIAVYGGIVNTFEEIIIIIISVLIILSILTLLPSVKFLQTVIKYGTRKGESQLESLINTFVTSSVSIILLLIFFDSRWIFMSAVFTVALGDGLGEFIGKPFGKHKYKILAQKSIEGSVGVFAGSLVGIMLSYYIFGLFTVSGLWVMIIISLIAMTIEAFSISFIDNIAMPSITAILLYTFL